MKTWIIDVLKFILFSFSIYLIMLVIFEYLINQRFRTNLITVESHSRIRLFEVKQKENIDILFLGSSHAYRGFDTRIFKNNGINTFNLGTSAQTPLQTELLIKRYCKSIRPKLVVLEVYPDLFSIEGIESSVDIIANDSIGFDMINLIYRQKNIKVINTFFVSWFKEELFGESPIENSKWFNNPNYHDGFMSRKITFNREIESFTKKKLNINKSQFDSFEKIINYLNINNFKYVLIQAPITKNRYNSNLDNAYFDSIMNSKGKYFNFNKIIKLNDSLHFYDSHHLNQLGVNIFNKKIIDTLIKEKI